MADRSFATANGQHVRASILSIQRGHDVEGKRFGALLALRPVERSRRGNRWLLQCDCGRYATRILAQLNRSVKDGNRPCCETCRLEGRRGFALDARSRRVALLAERFRKHGELYSWRALESMERDIARECEERLYVPIDLPDPRRDGVLSGFSLGDAIDMARPPRAQCRENSVREIADDLASWKATLPDIIARGIARRAGAEAAGATRG